MTRPSALDETVAAAIAEAVGEIARSVMSDRLARASVIGLLHAVGRLATVKNVAISGADFAAFLQEQLEIALLQTLGEDHRHLAEIRRFFLEPRSMYSLAEVAGLWRVPIEHAADICHDEIEQWEKSSGRETGEPFCLSWAESVATTVRFGLLRACHIERALGEQFLLVRSERWRTVPVLIRLPRFVAEAFHLDGTRPWEIALAHRIEQILLELFTTENLIDDAVV